MRINADKPEGPLHERAHLPLQGLGISMEFVDLAAEVFGILSDSTRIRIILALHGVDELPVKAIAEAVGKSPSGVSQHLARLRMARMVSTRQDGTRVLYRLSDEHASVLVLEAIKQAEHSVTSGATPPHHHETTK